MVQAIRLTRPRGIRDSWLDRPVGGKLLSLPFLLSRIPFSIVAHADNRGKWSFEEAQLFLVQARSELTDPHIHAYTYM